MIATFIIFAVKNLKVEFLRPFTIYLGVVLRKMLNARRW